MTPHTTVRNWTRWGGQFAEAAWNRDFSILSNKWTNLGFEGQCRWLSARGGELFGAFSAACIAVQSGGASYLANGTRGAISTGIRYATDYFFSRPTTPPSSLNSPARREIECISGFTKHAVDRAIERAIPPRSILDSLKHPIRTNLVRHDQYGRPSQRFIGKHSEVVVNPADKRVISVNKTSTKKLDKLMREIGDSE